ncbi:glycosyltransferase family 39 protein [uncultured Aliiroseovarius sp.]|uniref:glycosyltransferase family 39 protein n=1 Tax=uncultured Aliiroseovarius sp. TaxID=1658783 RepID=UPI00261F464F|nr:glycosyltransferase family 39 protein [uncultured Aliiroseovarius sp.]
MQQNFERETVWWAVRVFTILVVPFIGSYTLLEPFGRDQGIHATIAFGLDEGLVTYRDVYNMKPPLTTAMHWVSQALFGHSMAAIRALDLVIATLTVLGLIEIGRQLGRHPIFGFATAIGFSVLYFSYGYWEHAQTDGWAGFLAVPALLLMLRGWRRKNDQTRFAMMVGAGAILGVAFCFKYTIGGAGILVFVPLLANLIGKSDIRFYAADFLACCVGGVIALAAVVAVLVYFGAWADFIQIQEFVLSYIGYKNPDAPGILVGFLLPGMASIYVLGVVFSGLFCAASEWVKTKRSTALALCILWIFAGWLSGGAQGKGFAYHFLPLVPVYALLIGVGIEYFSTLFDDRKRSFGIACVLMLALYIPSAAAKSNKFGIIAFATGGEGSVYFSELKPTTDFDLPETLDVAAALNKHQEPGDTLFVWGYASMLYFLTETPPLYKYPYSWPFMVNHYAGQHNQDLIARLKASPPTRIVVQPKDAVPWVTGNQRSSEEQLNEFPELRAFITGSYRLIEQYPRFKLYELKAANKGVEGQ